MAEKYTCNKCGRVFDTKPEAKNHSCPLCGSLDVKKAEEQPASGCGASTRFS